VFFRRQFALDTAIPGKRYRIVNIVRPRRTRETWWDATMVRLEALGVFPGHEVQLLNSLSPLGPLVVISLGAKVALSKALASYILVEETPRSSSS